VRWLSRIFTCAAGRSNQAARSISGKACVFPLFGGHSISNVLLVIASASSSPSTANAVTRLPPRCRMSSQRFKRTCQNGTCLFKELSPRRDGHVLALIHFAFWNRPGPLVLISPERPAGMNQQDFQSATRLPIHQDTSA
jgi:hypothetical protein